MEQSLLADVPWIHLTGFAWTRKVGMEGSSAQQNQCGETEMALGSTMLGPALCAALSGPLLHQNWELRRRIGVMLL